MFFYLLSCYNKFMEWDKISNIILGTSIVILGIFVLVGLAWAAINVNSLPMVVEMCSGAEVGKFTGLYYTFSMAELTKFIYTNGK